MDRYVGLFGVGPRGYCGDKGVVEENGTKGLRYVVTDDRDQGRVEAMDEEGDDPLSDDEEDEDE